MFDIFSYEFMQRAFVAGIFVAILSPLIGSFLVIRRLSLISDTLAHVALLGVAIGLVTGLEPLLTTIFVTILSSLIIERLRSINKLPSESILAMFLPGGLAFAIILMSFNSGTIFNLSSYLFGSMTTITTNEVIQIGILSIFVIVFVKIMYRKLVYTAFDPDGAKLNGINTKLVNYLLMTLTAVTVSVTMKVIGVLLVGALMIIPVVTAMKIAKSFKQILAISVLVALFAMIVGLVVSFIFDIPTGPAIVCVSVILFLTTLLVKK